MSETSVLSLHRHPVKGLSPEPLDQVRLTRGEYFPGDRLYAIENGPSGFDPAAPVFLPKIKFLMLMKQGALAALQTRYEDAMRVLKISREGALLLRADLGREEGRAAVASFMAEFCKGQLRGPPRVLEAPPGFRFTDSLRSGFVSILSKATVGEIEKMIGKAIDPMRFRANILVEGTDPFEENEWVGQTLECGPLRLGVNKRIERCNATNVRPGTGERDLDLLRAMLKAYGHIDCGVYASVISSGPLKVGDTLRLAQ
ncbi:MAG TPA: MOSC domain-containing protein [Beijerinckiaceae bacterium]|nr:MOSC domain-containing protein [Beijerinckiaceae bacterium]